jgi:hypothetical protein
MDDPHVPGFTREEMLAEGPSDRRQARACPRESRGCEHRRRHNLTRRAMTCPLCRFVAWLRIQHTRRREAVQQVEKLAQPKPVYHDKMPERLARGYPEVGTPQWYRRRNENAR